MPGQAFAKPAGEECVCVLINKQAQDDASDKNWSSNRDDDYEDKEPLFLC